ncbi:MAG: ABC transporter ATP-binding protein [Desulfotomaculaceae bacterium]|nr:ABC transporter ATP-binding protein [Desulfotomaculaceae bacterium]
MKIYRQYFNKNKYMFFTGTSCVFFEALCDLMQPTIMARIIDQGVKNNSVETVLRFGLLMLLITLLGACFATVRNIMASRVSENFGADLRYDIFTKIMRFSEVSTDKISSGSLITRMTNDSSQVIMFVNGLMRIFFRAPIICLGSIILAFILSPQLSFILLLVVAGISIIIVITMKMSYIRFAWVQKAIDRVNTVVQEYLLGVRLVKAFGRYDEEEEKFAGVNRDLAHKSVSSQVVIAYSSPLMSLVVGVGIAGILYTGSILFGSGNIEVGKVAAYINYLAQILGSLLMITAVFNIFVRTKASTERINEVLNSGEDFPGMSQVTHDDLTGLYFKEVTFAYPNGSGLPAIKNLSFQVKRGETLAIIGPTGSGKSTIAWLCLRLYDVDQGAIYINDTDIRKLDSNVLRNNIALAPQRSMLFTGTVLENIAWGNPQASREDIIRAAQMAQADEFIQKMPESYDSLLGRGGVNLSGGQKQRISIARALVKQAPILILDDCTSALDSVTEAKVRKGLKTAGADKTLIIITQRIGTAMSADKILVLENGFNVGYGSHRALIHDCGTYRKIFESQIGGDLKVI